ncbi:DNA translocase FtsK-like [Aricia agestis]|uniref:DNA translocase FtsK-like n=1 Tax=Aricia agestis TaxID=91739 RepID=UPI001C204EF6|nr:DNA translocase FtsK-like [Aricia agestis]
MKIVLLFALFLCVHSEETTKDQDVQAKDKRQTQGESQPHIIYRTARKQEHVAPVEENSEDDRDTRDEEYRPGQVFSLNAQELLDLQPERKSQQQLYPEQQQKQQQVYYLEPQLGRQVYQPSHAVIARPDFSSNGGEASVGAALSVSDGANPGATFDQELLALLGQAQRQEERQYTPTAKPTYVPQYQQVDIPYVPKPSKKPTKLRPKVQVAPQPATAPQQYLIETTNVQQYQPTQQQYQPTQQYQPSQQYQTVQPQYQQYRQPQSQRVPQTLRYVQIQPTQATIQQAIYERPESSGLKIVAPPKLQQINPANLQNQVNYRLIPQYQQEATPKQYRLIEAPRQQARQEKTRVVNINERPVTYLKRFPEPEGANQRVAQGGEQFYVRQVYRPEQRARYEQAPLRNVEAQRSLDTKPPLSAIYVSQNIPKQSKAARPLVRTDSGIKYEPREVYRVEPSSAEQVQITQGSKNIDDQRAHLPPPKNNKAYTPEEFSALIAAGYSVTPIPVGQAGIETAQSRSSIDVAPAPVRRPLHTRRNHYLPLRVDDAP